MKSFITSFLLLALLTLPLLAGTSSVPTMALTPAIALKSITSRPSSLPMTTVEQSPLPGPNLATCNWTSNHILNPGFETWSNPQSPVNWGIYAPADAYQWFATQPPSHVSQGTYSLGLQCRAPYNRYSYAYVGQYSLAASMSNLTLRLDWFLDQNLDPANDGFYVQLYLYDGSNYHYLYYFLNGSTSASNSTTYGYYLPYGPAHQWNTLSRNVTADFLAIPTFPKPLPPSLQLENMWFQLYASAVTSNLIRAFVDAVSLKAGTTTVIGGSTRNGDFETPNWNNWGSGGDREASDARESATAHTGSWSLNLTAVSAGNQSYAYAYQPVNARLTSLNQGWANCWWWLTNTQVTWGSHAYVYFSCSNTTVDWFGLFYYLGYGGTTAPWGNDSYSLYLQADQFNTTGTWVAFHRNLWQDAVAYFHTSEILISQVYIVAEVDASGSRLGLLLDDSAVVSAAINGAGFEDQGGVGSQIEGWTPMTSDFTVTGTAYAGSKAANLTLPGGSTRSIEQSLAERPLNGTRETYLDLMWRLQDYTPNANTYAYVLLGLSNGRQLGYYVAVSSSPPMSNDSFSAWFNVTGVDTVGTWTAMHRDLVHDYQAAFASLPDITIDAIQLAVVTASGPRLVLLLDDLYLYDDPAPSVTNVQRAPTAPGHMEAVQVTATIVDQDLTARVLHYRLNTTTWQQVSMSSLEGNAFGASIPGQPHSTVVDYYVTANDTWGMMTTALNSGVYWTYTIPPATTTTTSTATGPPIPGFPPMAILLACAAALGFALLRRRRVRLR
jgi:hypothetical protein